MGDSSGMSIQGASDGSSSPRFVEVPTEFDDIDDEDVEHGEDDDDEEEGDEWEEDEEEEEDVEGSGYGDVAEVEKGEENEGLSRRSSGSKGRSHPSSSLVTNSSASSRREVESKSAVTDIAAKQSRQRGRRGASPTSAPTTTTTTSMTDHGNSIVDSHDGRTSHAASKSPTLESDSIVTIAGTDRKANATTPSAVEGDIVERSHDADGSTRSDDVHASTDSGSESELTPAQRRYNAAMALHAISCSDPAAAAYVAKAPGIVEAFQAMLSSGTQACKKAAAALLSVIDSEVAVRVTASEHVRHSLVDLLLAGDGASRESAAAVLGALFLRGATVGQVTPPECDETRVTAAFMECTLQRFWSPSEEGNPSDIALDLAVEARLVSCSFFFGIQKKVLG